MTTHLHVHLEPNERKRRQLGRAKSEYRDSVQFFSEHSLRNPDRLPVGLEDLRVFIEELHAEQRSQHVDYVELRLSPRRFMSGGINLEMVLLSVDSFVSGLEKPTLKLILLLNRDSSFEFIDACHQLILDGLPKNFVGIDLAGDEKAVPDTRRFESCFGTARSSGLGVTVHAGEFGGVENIWNALDQLGANRIAHAVSARGSRKLAARLSADQILVEASLSSNVALGAVTSLDEHPLPWLLENGVPACLNTDIPIHLGIELDDEWALGRHIMKNNDPALDAMENFAREHRFM